jgi:hypothetical protein
VIYCRDATYGEYMISRTSGNVVEILSKGLLLLERLGGDAGMEASNVSRWAAGGAETVVGIDC